MAVNLTVSQEFISIGGDKVLGKLIQGHIERIVALGVDPKHLDQSSVAPMVKDIGKVTGLNLGFELVPGDAGSAAIWCMRFHGHQGTSGANAHGTPPVSSKSVGKDPKAVLSGKVDLNKIRVTGEFAKLPFTFLLPREIFGPASVFTVEERTAILLHEVGHAFNTCSTFGEYVWLNYFLQEGVDVVLGKKSNVYRCDILTDGYLAANVDDPKLAETLRTDPTEQAVRRALLIVGCQKQRDHLNSTIGAGSVKRDEQLADWFASRLGYGRALVTALHNGKLGASRWRMSKAQHYATQVLYLTATVSVVAAGGMLVAGGAALGGWLMIFTIAPLMMVEVTEPPRYDNMVQRITKLRLDLISQLKSNVLTPAQLVTVEEDLQIVTEVLKQYTEHRSVGEVLTHVIFPTYRRRQQNLKHEQVLEALLNNDLFVTANLFRTNRSTT